MVGMPRCLLLGLGMSLPWHLMKQWLDWWGRVRSWLGGWSDNLWAAQVGVFFDLRWFHKIVGGWRSRYIWVFLGHRDRWFDDWYTWLVMIITSGWMAGNVISNHRVWHLWMMANNYRPSGRIGFCAVRFADVKNPLVHNSYANSPSALCQLCDLATIAAKL